MYLQIDLPQSQEEARCHFIVAMSDKHKRYVALLNCQIHVETVFITRAYVKLCNVVILQLLQKGDEAWRRFFRGPGGTGTPAAKKQVGTRGVVAHTVMPVSVYAKM
jgi:hypothetical protein